VELSNAVTELNKENHTLKSVISELKTNSDQQSSALKAKEKEIEGLKAKIENSNNLLNQSNKIITDIKNQFCCR
jgi:uncharacterized coiled-coil DUF342 family protein